MKIRVRVAVLEPEGPLLKEAGLEVKEGLTLARLFKQADKSLSLKRKVFKPCLGGGSTATVLINGDRVELDRAGAIVLKPGDEVSLVSGLAGG